MTVPKRSRVKSPANGPTLQFRLRVMHRGEIALGPGKVELLRAILTQGSISKGAKSLGMSYMRAWTLVKVMNRCFRDPVIVLERGGTKGGAARLTPLGRDVLELYLKLIEKCESASHDNWTELQKRLKE